MAKLEFKAEIKQLLEIITHSIYTNREIFLRELISNASDALDKLRFEVSRGAIPGTEEALEIRISVDKDKNLLTISDNGIGMSEAELVENIGTIAKSGSAEFLKNLAADASQAGSIIGRFGVGFYSVFMVADKVVLTSKSAREGEPAQIWTSDGLGSFDIEPGPADFPRGTSIEVHLKDEAKDFADPARVKSVIKQHSNFLSFPILVDGEKVNTVSALWREPKFTLKKEQYDEFYKFLTFDYEEPLDYLHLSVDAPVQFSSVVFIPKRGGDSLGLIQNERGLDLYARRVLIQKSNKDLVPEYLGFLKGVVDAEDLPLNISRETLQENVLIRKMASTVTKQVLEKLSKIASEDKAKYAEFWKEHAKVFKMGYNDYPNRELFQSLLRFEASDAPAGELVGLDECLAKASSERKEIYYISGPSRAALDLSPHLEIFRKKGLFALYLYEPVDEFIMDTIGTYKEYKLIPVERADAKALSELPDAADSDAAEALTSDQESSLKGLLARIKEILGERVTEVTVSGRLTLSPACLVSPEGEMTSQMQKILRLVNKDASIPKKALELNRDNPLVRNLIAIFAANPDDEFIVKAAEQLYESALLLEGYLADPHKMVGRVNELMELASSLYVKK